MKNTPLHIINKNEAIIEGCKQGHSSSQLKIYKLYYHSMYNITLRIVKDTGYAEDIMQESFLKAFENINSYENKSTFGSWLKRIVVNRSLDHMRKENKLTYTDNLEQIENLQLSNTRTDNIDNSLINSISSQLIQNEILNLPGKYSIVLNLYLIEGYDHTEISQILKITSGYSRSILSRGKIILRNRISNLIRNDRIELSA